MYKKNILLILSILFIVLILLYGYYQIHFFKLDEKIITTKEKESIIKSRKEYKKDIILYYENNEIPYIKNLDYYLLSVNDKDNFYNKIVNHDNFKMKIYSKEEYKIKIIIYNKKYYKLLNLEITNLPVIKISKKDKFDNYDKLSLYDSNESRTIVNDYNINYNLRGGTSLLSEKKSYKVNLFDKDDKKLKVSLLNMSEDDDWILNPIWLDDSYMREKIAYDLWDNISSKYNHKLEYVELIIDDDYKGIYYLQEKIDLDTFKANKKDLLISIKEWYDDVEHTLFNENLVLNSDNIDEYEIEKGIENNKLRLKILRSFVNTRWGNNPEINIAYDLDNNADYTLFLNLIIASDNTSKNQKILFKNNNDSYTVYKTPWDLDRTLGNEYTKDKFDINKIYVDYAIPEYLRKDILFNNKIKEKYFNLRKDIYTEENINNLINKYSKYLNKSGALNRDTKRWNKNNFDYSTNEIKNFIKERIQVLDKYYGGYNGV